MERTIWRECRDTLAAGEPPHLRTLSVVRSLIANPSTSDATVSSILETLLSLLPLHHHHTLSLLTPLFLSRPNLSGLIFSSISSLFSSSNAADASSRSLDAAAAALSVLASVAETDPSFRSAIDCIDDGLMLDICSRPSLRVRIWFLNNASRLRIRADSLARVLIGFTKDPYPGVRRAALDGLLKAYEEGVAVDDCGIVNGGFLRAFELMRDSEDDVRAAAIRVVSKWGEMLMATKSGSDLKDCSDFLFIQLCSMVRDMSMVVRLEAFDAIGKVRVVSDDVLLLTLFKRVQGNTNEKKVLCLSSRKYEVPSSLVAGAFLHGVEDEFSEVRRSSCKSIQTCCSISSRFASDVVSLLMDVLNDDSEMVRLQALEAIHDMALSNRLKLQQEHLQAFVDTMADNSVQIRNRAMEVLGMIKLPSVKLLKPYVETLLGNLDIYPQVYPDTGQNTEFLLLRLLNFHHVQDEDKTLCALFRVGQNNGKQALLIIEKAYNEMTGPSGTLVFDKTEVTGLVVLGISASVSAEAPFNHILQNIYSAAVVYLGRISYALREVFNQDALLAFLSHSGRPSLLSTFRDESHFLSSTDDMDTDNKCVRSTSSIEFVKRGKDDWVSEVRSRFTEGSLSLADEHNGVLVKVTESIRLVLATTRSSWQLAKSSCTSEALKVLSCCREEMDIIGAGTAESSSILAFGLQYVRVVNLLTRILDHVIFPRKHFPGTGYMNILLQKLDKHITRLRYRFTGFAIEDELHILEFVLLNYLLRLSIVPRCCKTLKKLSNTISDLANLCQRASATPSEFASELEKLFGEDCSSREELSHGSLLIKKMFNIFDLREIILFQGIKHAKAELQVSGFDSEHPFSFIPGMPVGIPCEITLYNVSNQHGLWLNMKMDTGLSEYLFLDLDEFEGHDGVKKNVFSAPFYGTPDRVAFTLTVSVSMECLSEDFKLVKGQVGPKHQLAYLCEEKEIQFFTVGMT